MSGLAIRAGVDVGKHTRNHNFKNLIASVTKVMYDKRILVNRVFSESKNIQ